jgi:pimeloyl-ACP methyl ester carboxylesterase
MRASLLLLALASAASAQSVTGDWQGTLKVGSTSLRLVLHFTDDGRGGIKGAMDSVDQGAMGIPVTQVSFKNSKLAWRVDPIHASYDGKLNAAGDTIEGTFVQGEPFTLDLKRMSTAPADKPTDIDGAWIGSITTGGIKLRLVFHFKNTSGGIKATMDSVDQSAEGIPVSSVSRNGADLKMDLKEIGARFEGTIHVDSIDGAFIQNGLQMPLALTRLKDGALTLNRPQNPKKPYPYREVEVTYQNKQGGNRLAATFTIPQGKGPFPAVLLITGSGPQDRDESLMGHKPFLVLADYLTRHGIAVLRADDRGVGKSTGDFGKSTTADFATDTEAGIAWLKTRSEVNHARIGLIGHSEGGLIAPMVASRNRDVAFIVMLAGTGVSGRDIMPAQVIAINEASGMPHDQAVQAGEVEARVVKLVETEKDQAKLREQLTAILGDKAVDANLEVLNSPWFQMFLALDPAEYLSKVKCPVLALNGTKDTQVVATQNLPAIYKALKAGGNQNFEVVEMPGLNHLFQTAKTGAATEYGEIEETIAPAVLEKIVSFIQKL